MRRDLCGHQSDAGDATLEGQCREGGVVGNKGNNSTTAVLPYCCHCKGISLLYFTTTSATAVAYTLLMVHIYVILVHPYLFDAALRTYIRTYCCVAKNLSCMNNSGVFLHRPVRTIYV